MYSVVLSICYPIHKDQECNKEYYEDIDNKQDNLGLLRCIKKLCTQMVRTTHTLDTTMYSKSLITTGSSKNIISP